MAFIDNISREVWAHGLNTKDEVLGVFKSFHMVQSNNGDEQIGQFEDYSMQIGSVLTRLYQRRLNKMVLLEYE